MRAFAVIPAAGRSTRMGTPKLLLPWQGVTVLEHLLAAWSAGGLERRIVVVHPADHEIAQLAAAVGAEVVTPSVPPPEMKDSIRAGLDYIDRKYAPAPSDLWLLAPADMPNLSAAVIRQLLGFAPEHPGAILVPTHDTRRGHPVLFRWSMTEEVARLASNEGVNQLLRRYPLVEIPINEESSLRDLDTPADYERLLRDEGRLPPP